ncbi:TIGR01440 family protein [Pseudogracilibacillus sp. SE30717A]|uniref:TIGR01440 family protein n=1 Tax=Pseudogracilibacillus sp. SE30717A TaxID=3098293 RepID=UPI00300E53EF
MLNEVKKDLERITLEWLENDYLKPDNLFVVGCSTSEVAGKHIGTSGSEEIAEVIFYSLNRLAKEKGIHLAFQCCEHLNRALVIEKRVQENLNLEPVSVIPVPTAGGSMASFAYNHLGDAVVVEEIAAHAGMDIGDTMIGMHLKKVAVPLRFNQKTIGNAHVTAARTRPKLIGGSRAKYA